MPTVSLRVTDEERAAWAKAAGGPRKLSAWLRAQANAAIPKEEKK